MDLDNLIDDYSWISVHRVGQGEEPYPLCDAKWGPCLSDSATHFILSCIHL